MNIDDYRYILTIAEEESITKAAKQLYITQPALSQRLKQIQGAYEINIFSFDSDGAHLTRDGLCFIKYARKILSCDENLKRELADLHGLRSGTLRIGFSQLASSAIFQDIVTSFHQAFPNVQLRFIEEPSIRIESYLLSGKADIGILHFPSSKELNSEVIFHDRLVLIPRYQSQLKEQIYRRKDEPISYISPRALADEPLAIPEEGTKTYALISSIFESAGITPHIYHWSKNYGALTCLANAGLASTIILESYLSKTQLNLPYYYFDCSVKDYATTAISWPADRYLSHIAQEFITLTKHVWQNRIH